MPAAIGSGSAQLTADAANQVSEILSLASKLGLTDDQLAKACFKRGAMKAEELSGEMRLDLLYTLAGKAREKSEKESPDPFERVAGGGEPETFPKTEAIETATGTVDSAADSAGDSTVNTSANSPDDHEIADVTRPEKEEKPTGRKRKAKADEDAAVTPESAHATPGPAHAAKDQAA